MTPCAHCGLLSDETFCCLACRSAHAFLRGEGLERFYTLRGDQGVAVPEARSDAYADPGLDVLIERALRGGSLRVDVQGIHCAGCVWLIEELFVRRRGARIDIEPTRGSAVLHVHEGFDLRAFRGDLRAVGYGLSCPGSGSDHAQASDDLMLRMAICIALAVNVMLVAFADYLGLRSSPLQEFLDRAAFGAGVLAVGVGGSVFIRSALAGLRRGLVGMDLPVAIGITLAFVASSARYFLFDDSGFVDTLTVFIALMLVGRFLQERALERARRRVIDTGASHRMFTRRMERGIARTRRCEEVAAGDELFFGCGDLVPVDTRLSSGGVFTLDWITGEQGDKAFAAGATVPAGAFSRNEQGIRGHALSSFGTSIVPRLLRETRDADPGDIAWWARVGGGYAILVLAAAAVGALLWLMQGEPRTALDVATAVLVVTCPCAFGIALPLAREQAHAELRRAGLHVRTNGFLERLSEVDRVVFDKTGTLTTGALELSSRIEGLEPEVEEILASLAQSSVHPRSRVLAAALRETAPCPTAREVPGRGVVADICGRTYRLGLPSWVAPGAEHGDADIAFGVDGELLYGARTIERLRDDAIDEVSALSQHKDVVIASGDSPRRVEAVAARLGVSEAFGGMRPEDKAEFVRANGPERTLMMGDGLNDHLALLEARCAGTPVIDRPFVASRCDFYLTAPGLAPIGRAFDVATWLRGTQRALLGIALAYNVFAVSLAWAGLVAPWVAALLMPLSSLLTLSFVGWRAHRLGERERRLESRAVVLMGASA